MIHELTVFFFVGCLRIIDFLWAEGLDKHVYPQILELLETYSFNGHSSTSKETKRAIKPSASNGTGSIPHETGTLVHGLEGNHDFDDEEGGHSTAISALNTPNRSPLIGRHTFVSGRRSRSSSRLAAHSSNEAQEQQYQGE